MESIRTVLAGVALVPVLTALVHSGPADKDRLPKPYDQISWNRREFERSFSIEGQPRLARKGEFPGADANDTIVWTLKAKRTMPPGVVGSIFGRRYAVFQKGTDTGKTEDRVARLRVVVEDRYLIKNEGLEKGKTIEAWVILGKARNPILQQADFMWIDIELE